MNTANLRQSFLKFFHDHNHKILPSSSTILYNDPSLLFTNAGMNQFKPLLLGEVPQYKAVTTAQKCIRAGGKHNDLNNVGFTQHHLTFFEMLGNFSFGEYFKEKAIKLAFDFTTTILQIDIEKNLWISIYREDEESFEIWQQYLPAHRIVRRGEKDNFWAMGEQGPCGPCSELFFDRGEKYGKAASPKEDPEGKRFIEFWNLVFMQYEKNADALLSPLPTPCIDTGMGLERMLMIINNLHNVFETDILAEIIHHVEKKTEISYHQCPGPFHVIADHLRMLTFSIADGGIPSNLDRGYVMRKILRRAVRYGKKLGFHQPFLAQFISPIIDLMSHAYPELQKMQRQITEIITKEEELFFHTLQKGGNILNSILEMTGKMIPGKQAFFLKDTYGFPLEEILLLAKDNNLTVDLEEYLSLEQEAKRRSKQKKPQQDAPSSLQKETETLLHHYPPTQFVGYTHVQTEARVIAILVNGLLHNQLQENEEGEIILDRTPFYPEEGGQVGDSGCLSHATGHFFIQTTTKLPTKIWLHHGRVSEGAIAINDIVYARVDQQHRACVARNHTATHLLHWALESLLGEGIRQSGSYVHDKGFRFDFTHYKPLSHKEIRLIEQCVNKTIRCNTPVITTILPYKEIEGDQSIKKLFANKYEEFVRVVNISDFSRELCCGTHVSNLGYIGLFRIISESSISSGIRRIEAVTGEEAENFMFEQEDLLQEILASLSTKKGQVKEKIAYLLEETKKYKEKYAAMHHQYLISLQQELLHKKETISSIPIICAKVPLSTKDLAHFAKNLLHKMQSGILCLATSKKDSCLILIKVTPNLLNSRISAQKLLDCALPCINGSGGGKPDHAQGFGKDPNQISLAFQEIKKFLAVVENKHESNSI